MTANKKTVEKFMAGFNKSDHEQILSCLSEDVEWEMPGAFHLFGKDAFDGEIENDAFVGSPTVTVFRMIEENDVVIAEGAVQARKMDGGLLNALFCDVFVMEKAQIKRLTSYLVEVKAMKPAEQHGQQRSAPADHPDDPITPKAAHEKGRT